MSDQILNQEPQDVEQSNAEVTQSAPESPAVTNESTWYSEEHNSFIESKGFKSPDDVIKSYANLERMVGNSVRIPPADASPEAKQEFYNKIKEVEGVAIISSDEEARAELFNKLGRPESADQYKLQEIIDQEVMQGVPYINEELESFQGLAHEIGLTKEQAAKLVEMRSSQLKQIISNDGMQRAESEKALKSMWGTDYENRLNAAKQMARTYAEKYPDQMGELINGPAGNNPAFLNMLAEMASTYKEKGHEGLAQAQFGITPEQALTKIADRRADSGFMKAYTDDRHPGHAKAVQELTKLYQIANGG